MKLLSVTIAAIISSAAVPAIAGLVGTDLTLSTLQQVTATSAQFTSSFPRVARVSASSVEFPDVTSLFNPGDPRPPGFGALVNTSIDAGDDYIEIDFLRAGSGQFASAFENTYIFQFDSTALATITGATIDASRTTLGLAANDVRFLGNRLFVNVESLNFNPTSFARINLRVVGGPTAVPEPGTLPLMFAAVGVLAFFSAGRKAQVRGQKKNNHQPLANA